MLSEMTQLLIVSGAGTSLLTLDTDELKQKIPPPFSAVLPEITQCSIIGADALT